MSGIKLVCSVARSDGDRQRIDTGAGDEVNNFFRLGIGGFLVGNFIFDSGKNSELAFNGYIVGVGVLDDLLRQSDVFLIGKVRTVDHDGGESVVDTLFTCFKAVTVV